METEPADTTRPTVNPPAHSPAGGGAAELAQMRGWMPLTATGVPAFLVQHPEWDGRGVLIGIMDSGIDAGVAGLDSTTTGRSKLLDLRDFSGEGRVPLQTVTPVGDSVVVAGRALRGIRPGAGAGLEPVPGTPACCANGPSASRTRRM